MILEVRPMPEQLDEGLSPPRIHPTAIIHSSARIQPGAEVGPFCILGKDVEIGPGTVLHPNVHIVENTRIGRNCQIHSGAVIGGPPQDHKFKDEPSYLVIGDSNIFRECVTVHRATGEGTVTRVGNHCLLMAYAHIGHNCVVGNHVTIASYTGISGHVLVEDYANFGGISGVHQFCRIGTMAMVGGMSGVTQDVPPFMLASGRPARVLDINKHALKRAGIVPKVRNELREAYKLLYRSELNTSQALERIEEDIEKSSELNHLLNFVHNMRNGGNGRGNNPPPLP